MGYVFLCWAVLGLGLLWVIACCGLGFFCVLWWLLLLCWLWYVVLCCLVGVLPINSVVNYSSLLCSLFVVGGGFAGDCACW